MKKLSDVQKQVLDKMECKYPDITVELVGQNGNAFAILGMVRKALKKSKVDQKEIDEFMTEAMNGDYDHLLQTVMKWVEVE